MSWQPKKTVVVPVDFSDASIRAVHTALDCAESPEAVHVIHAVMDLEPVSAYGYWAGEDVDITARKKAAQEHLDAMLAENGITGVQAEVLLGDPGRRIVEYADELQADLIVIPSHGYHGFKRFLMGSTAERVIRHAHCAVFVLRYSDE